MIHLARKAVVTSHGEADAHVALGDGAADELAHAQGQSSVTIDRGGLRYLGAVAKQCPRVEVNLEKSAEFNRLRLAFIDEALVASR